MFSIARRATALYSASLAGLGIVFAPLPKAAANSDMNTVLPFTSGTRITPGSPVQLGTRYGRIVRLGYSGASNGTLIATFESWPSEFGIYKSTDDGLTWTQIATTTETQLAGWTFKVEPDLFELPNAAGNLPAGTILLAGNAENGNAHRMEIYYSLDHGVTWQYRGLVDSNGTTGKGMWEPRLNVTNAGQLICYYSDERFTPTYNQLLGERVSPDGGLTWGAEQYAVAIPDGVQRPGMAVTAKLPNGQYVMSFECVGAGAGSPVHIKFSNDGINWGTGPADYGIAVKNANGAYPGACPYIMWSPAGGPKGTLIVSGVTLTNSPNADRELFVNYNLGQGNWSTLPCPVQWQGGNGLSGWSMGMIPTADGQGIIQLASSAVNGNTNEMRVGRARIVMPGATYAVSNENSGLVVDVPAGTNVHGTLLQQYALLWGTAQSWTFNDQGNNIWTVINAGNGLAWDDLGWNTAQGAPVDQWDANGAAVQQWRLRPVGDGSWKFVNVNSGLVMAVNNASTANGAGITQWTDNGTRDHNWNLLQNGIPEGTYKIVASTTGNVLDCYGASTANGTIIQEWPYAGGNNQRWNIHNLGNGYYSIRSINPDATLGRSLDCTGCSPNDGTQIELWDYNGATCQQWAITPTTGNNYKISTAGTKADGTHDVLDGNGCSGAPGAHVILWSWGGGTCQQQWQLVPAN